MLNKKSLSLFLIIGIITLFGMMTGCDSDSEANDVDIGEQDENENEKEKQDDELEELFKEADKVALEYYQAHYEYDIPTLFDLSPPKVQEKYLNGNQIFFFFNEWDEENEKSYSVEPIEDLIDPEKFKELKEKYDTEDYHPEHYAFFQDFNEIKDDFYMYRFIHLYNESDEVSYYLYPWMKEVETAGDPPMYVGKSRETDYGYIKLKQNADGEWKVIEAREGELRKEGVDTTNGDELKTKGTLIHEPKDNEEEEEDDYGFD